MKVTKGLELIKTKRLQVTKVFKTFILKFNNKWLFKAEFHMRNNIKKKSVLPLSITKNSLIFLSFLI